MNIRLDPARPADRDTLFRLLQYSLYEESATDQNEMNDDGLYDYPWFDLYFTEDNRHAYLIREEGTDRLLGFAMVKDRENGREGYKIAEFMVLPKVRRNGIGRQAAIACFERFPGNWEVSPALGSEQARRFWERTIEAYTDGRYRWQPEERVFTFSSGGVRISKHQ